MADFRNQILIIEDDVTLREAMKEFFARSGFTVFATARTFEASDLLKQHPIGTLFVDCLMPEQSGVEYVESIRSEYPATALEVVLMSGVFTDSSFVKDALRTTGAKHFLKKPFQLPDLLNLVEKPAQEVATVPAVGNVPLTSRKALYSFFAKGQVTAREKKKVIESLDEIHGFDLPFIYNLLVDSKTSGHLNLATAKGDIIGVSFAEGQIVSVDIPDKATFLGRLLLDSGYITSEDLLIAEADTSKARFGEKLVANYSASPHAIVLCMEEQLGLRLSKTVVDETVQLNFVEAEVENRFAIASPDAFHNYLHDWISSKISVQWLRAQFVQWLDSTFVKTASFQPDHPALQAPLVLALPGAVDALLSGQTLGQILDSQKFTEEPFLKTVQYLLTRGVLALSEARKTSSLEDRKKLLKKLRAQFTGLNKLQSFDLMIQMVAGSNSDPKSVLREFQRVLGGPPPATDKELVQNFEFLNLTAQQAVDFSVSGGGAKLREELFKADAEKKMKVASSMNEAQQLLQKGSFRPAQELLRPVKTQYPNAERVRLYWCWAQIGSVESSTNKANVIREVDLDMLQIPPEEKLDAVFYLVQGLTAKAKGDINGARKGFEKASALNSDLISARRELSMLDARKNPRENVFEKDIVSMFGSIFKKRTG